MTFEEKTEVRVKTFQGVVPGIVEKDTGGPSVNVRIDGRIRVVPRSKIVGSGVERATVAKAANTERIVVNDKPRARPYRKMGPPARSEHFLAFVREMPCCACCAPSPSDPHHYGPRGTGQKTDDFRVVPLCRRCHDVFHDTGALPTMDANTTRYFFFMRQVDILVAYLKRIDADRREESRVE